MVKGSLVFDFNRAVTVLMDEKPELYDMAEYALLNGNGTFTYEGVLWEVGEGTLDNYLVIRPEVPNR